jgi:hypothetical protein
MQMDERSPVEHFPGFIEPRQLSLDERGLKEARSHPALSRDSLIPQPPLEPHDREHDRMARPYAGLEHSRYPSPMSGRYTGPPEFTTHGSRGEAFLWSGDYGPGTLPGGPDDYHPLPFEDMGYRLDGRHHMGAFMTNYTPRLFD